MSALETPKDPNFGFLHALYQEAGVEFAQPPSGEERVKQVVSGAHGLIKALKARGEVFPVLNLPDPGKVLEFIPVQFRPIEFHAVEERNLLEEDANPSMGYRGTVQMVSPYPHNPIEQTLLGSMSVVERGFQAYFSQIRLARGTDESEVFSDNIHGAPNRYIDSQEAMNFIGFAGSYLEQLEAL